MRNLFYTLFIIFFAAILVSLFQLDFQAALWSSANNFQWMTIGASVCGILLCVIFLKFQTLKENLKIKSKI